MLWNYWSFTASRVHVTNLITAQTAWASFCFLKSLFKDSKRYQRRIVPDLKNHPFFKEMHECCHLCSSQQIHCTAISYLWKPRGLGSLLAHSPLWRAVNVHDRYHLPVQARGVQQGRHFLFPERVQRAFKNTLCCRILLWAFASYWL